METARVSLKTSVQSVLFSLLVMGSCLAWGQSDPMQAGQQCNTGNEPACALTQTNPQSVTLSQQALLPSLLTPTYSQPTDPRPKDQASPAQNATRRHIETPPTEFEQMVEDSVGRKLRIFGMSLFETSPTTFAPVAGAPVPADYVIGPGDEIEIRIWGQVNLVVRATVDRTGNVFIPQVGDVNVAGTQYSKLEERLKNEVSRVFKNFHLSASLGRLRSVQLFVVGEALDPGEYTVGSLSSLVNAVFASGGPKPNGSLRSVQLKRGATVVTEFDLYDLLIKGDKSKDVPILPGDVIYFPPAGGFAAVAGSVGVPAIYELRGTQSIADLVDEAGGPTVVSDNQRVTVERIESSGTRTVFELSLEKAHDVKAQKGDIVRVLSLVPRFDNTVTLRGHVANPGRYQWKPGMHVRDLIPDVSVLLTRDYFMRQAKLTNGRSTEYPIPAPQRRMMIPPQGGDNRNAPAPANRTAQGQGSDPNANAAAAQNAQAPEAQVIDPAMEATRQREVNEETLQQEIHLSAPEVNWDYALIQRVNPVDLTTALIPFNLGKAVVEKSDADNIALQSGDIVTIFSQQDVSVSQARRTIFVKVEGEVGAPGIYMAAKNDDLRSIVQKAGGLTPEAYLYGSRLTRNSVQEQEQKSIDDFVKLLSAQMQQTMAAAANGNPDLAGSMPARMSAQQSMVSALREVRAPGRVVLELPPRAASVGDLPPIALEDGDRFVIPHRPAVVTVIGAVYNQGSFLFNPKRKVNDYFALAGRNTPIADKRHMFVLRADGSVLTREGHSALWKGDLGNYRMQPGDTLVVPSKLQIGMFQRNLLNWTQIFSQMALTAASLAVVSKQ